MPRKLLPLLIALLMPGLATPIELLAAEPPLLKNPFKRPAHPQAEKPRSPAKTGQKRKSADGTPALSVTAILISDSQPMALVNGRMLRIGDRLRGARLVAVEEQAAWFEYRGRRLKYRLRSKASSSPTPNL